MLRVILENRNKSCMTSVNDCDTEIAGIMVSLVKEDLQDIKERSVKVVQSMVDIWDKHNLGYEEVEEMFRDYYLDKREKGYTIDYLNGESYHESIINDLTEDIYKLDKENKMLKSALKMVCRLKVDN